MLDRGWLQVFLLWAPDVYPDRVSACDFDVTGLLVTVVTRSSSAPGTPESVRENVWPGRTALSVHWSTAALSTRLTMTLKPSNSRSIRLLVSNPHHFE